MDMEDLYASEKEAIAQACGRLECFEFNWTGNIEQEKRFFEMAAVEEFGKAGFGIHVHWEEFVRRTPLGDVPTGVWQPSIQDVHRLKKDFAFDHDQFKREVATGQHGGGAFYIREDGTKHEEPIKKIIT